MKREFCAWPHRSGSFIDRSREGIDYITIEHHVEGGVLKLHFTPEAAEQVQALLTRALLEVYKRESPELYRGLPDFDPADATSVERFARAYAEKMRRDSPKAVN